MKVKHVGSKLVLDIPMSTLIEKATYTEQEHADKRIDMLINIVGILLAGAKICDKDILTLLKLDWKYEAVE